MLKVVKNKEDIIKMSQLEFGEVAVVVDELTAHVGKIVMCMYDSVSGGQHYVVLDGTGNFFSGDCEHLVKILQPGDMLEVMEG